MGEFLYFVISVDYLWFMIFKIVSKIELTVLNQVSNNV